MQVEPAPEVGQRWWRIWRVLAAIVVAVLIGSFAFVYRFNMLGGTFAGFDNDHFVHLLRSDMLLNGQQPLRDFAEAELRGAWPSLGYEMSAWAQRWWGSSLLSEAYLTVGGLAVAAAIAFVVALDLSRRWIVALLVALCVIATGPKLYNYEKVLVLVVGIALCRLWVVRPTRLRLGVLALWTAIAALFRHDFAVYVGVAVVCAVVALHGGRALLDSAAGDLRRAAVPIRKDLALYVGITLILLLPSLIWVQRYAGLGSYLQASLASAGAESLRTQLTMPAIDFGGGMAIENMLALTYYAFWAVALFGVVALVRLVQQRRFDPATLATLTALAVVAVLGNQFFLRANLGARFGDAVVPVALLAACLTAIVPRLRQARGSGLLAWSAPRLLLLVILSSVFVAGEVRAELARGELWNAWPKVPRRFIEVRDELAQSPPTNWSGVRPQGSMLASRYLAECTAFSDRVLVVTYAPELAVFARRLFAAGQGTFGLGFYESDRQQDQAIARLQHESVPIVIGSVERYDEEFVRDYPRVAKYVASRYRDAGAIPVNDTPRFRVLVDRNRQAARSDPHFGLPCFQ